MMTAINGVMLAAGSSLAALIVVKVTIVVELGLAAARLARRSRAAVRHALLAVTFGATLVLPIASIVAPPVHVTVPVAEVSRTAWPLVVNTTAPIPPVTTAADGARVAPAAPQQSSTFSLSVLLLTGWIVGTAVFLVPVMTGLWQIRSLRRSGLPWLDGQSIAETLARDAGIHRRVEVMLHEALPGPITCGVLGPAIMLPRDAESWAREDLSRAMVHELEHVRRGDSATRCLARAACALYWFHPLAWIAWRRLVLEAERSCDDAVLKRSEATAYADQLVGLAKLLPTAQRSPLLAMASRSDLSARVGAVLDGGQQRGRVGRFSLILACAAAVLLVIVMSPLMLVAAPQAKPAGAPKFEVASIKLCRNSDPFPGGRDGGSGPSPGRLHLECANVGNLIKRAYLQFPNGEKDGQMPSRLADKVLGIPGWIDSDHYTIDATTETPQPSALVLGPMMQALLEDRFKLRIHRAIKVQPVYELRAAKTGVKLQPAKGGNCLVVDSDHPPPLLPERGQSMPASCGGFNGQYMYGATMHGLSQQLSFRADRDVVDKTGLAGTFDLDFGSSPDLVSPIPEEGFPGLRNPNDRVSAFYLDALSKLGLKLVPANGPTTVLVIDHIERPSEN